MFKIKWTPEAEEQYLHHLEYWINHNKSTSYSLKIIEEVSRIENLISNNPYIGQLVENLPEPVRRILILTNFSLFYRINHKKETLEILSFWGNKMNPDDINI